MLGIKNTIYTTSTFISYVISLHSKIKIIIFLNKQSKGILFSFYLFLSNNRIWKGLHTIQDEEELETVKNYIIYQFSIPKVLWVLIKDYCLGLKWKQQNQMQ